MNRHPISVIVQVLMATDGVKQEQLAEPAGVSEATISRRLKSGGWNTDEIEGLAEFFHVPVATFFKHPDEVREVIAGYLAAA